MRSRSPVGRALSAVSLAALVVTLALVAGCGLSSSGPPAKAGSLLKQADLKGQSYTVGGMSYYEQLVLCQIAVAALESVNATVTERCDIGANEATRGALLRGDIDLYWEYTGSAWVSFLGQHPIRNSHAQYEAVKHRDLIQNKIVWLQRTYGFAPEPDQVRVLQTGAIYQATAEQKECLFGEVFTTDGRIAQLGLRVLVDDKHYHLLYTAAPTLREAVYDRDPNIAKVFAPISAALTNAVMTELNRQRSAEGRSARRVARDWLARRGFIAQGS